MQTWIRRSIFGFAALMAAASPIQAAVMVATATGTVLNSTNLGGLFGGGNLDGREITLVFTYDPATPGASRTIIPLTLDSVETGPTGISPMISVSGTIGAFTETIHATAGSAAIASDNPNSELHLYGTGESGYANASAIANPFTFPYSLDEAVPPTSDLLAGSIGNFLFLPCLLDCLPTFGDIAVTSVAVAAIPLPAPLVLLSSGAGVLLWLSRRRRTLDTGKA